MSSIDNILTREYGISPELCALAEETERQVRGEFERIDRVRDYNQLKVLRSMQKNGLAERHFNFSTGYGYADIGRDLLDRIFADAFGCACRRGHVELEPVRNHRAAHRGARCRFFRACFPQFHAFILAHSGADCHE